jgi:hypothetical protein
VTFRSQRSDWHAGGFRKSGSIRVMLGVTAVWIIASRANGIA